MTTAFDASSPLFHEILALHGKWRKDRDAVICEDETLSWSAFAAGIHQFANALLAHGIEPRDRVVVLMTNGIEMAQALFGCMPAGCASVPINLTISDNAIAAMIRDAGATAIIATGDQAQRIDRIADALGDSPRLFVTTGESLSGWIGWQDFLSGAPTSPPAVEVGDDDLLNIIYSSGTTGTPKGIAHTHRGRRDWACDLAIALRYHGGARTLLTIGLYSNISWVAMLCTLLAGGTIIIQRHFDAHAVLDDVARLGITHTAMVPIQFQRIVDAFDPAHHDVSSMHAMMCCGSPLHEGLKRGVFEVFPCGVIELYGLTEGIITTLDPEDAAGRWSSVGKPLIGTDIRILDDDDNEMPPGVAGEIVSTGRITMPGYLNRPDANDEATWIDERGRRWLRSGDIGKLDDEGFLYIVDRKKDMILSGGQNVYPQDIEAVLIGHADVEDVAVIGAESSRWGETPVAIVVPREGRIDRDELVAWCNARVGKQQRIADVRTVDALPRNPNGKILKRELRKTFASLAYD